MRIDDSICAPTFELQLWQMKLSGQMLIVPQAAYTSLPVVSPLEYQKPLCIKELSPFILKRLRLSIPIPATETKRRNDAAEKQDIGGSPGQSHEIRTDPKR